MLRWQAEHPAVYTQCYASSRVVEVSQRVIPAYLNTTISFATASGYQRILTKNSGVIDVGGFFNKVVQVYNADTSNLVDYSIKGAAGLSGPWWMIGSGQVLRTSASIVSNNSVWHYIDVQAGAVTSNTLTTSGRGLVYVTVMGVPVF